MSLYEMDEVTKKTERSTAGPFIIRTKDELRSD